jgi:predicted metalloendopeptidase
MRKLATLLFAALAIAAAPLPRAGDDFYGYANGDWLAATALPGGRVSYDTTAMLRDTNTARVHALLEDAAAKPGSKAGDYYASFLDTAAIAAKGFTPLAADLAAIAAIQDRRRLSTYLGTVLRLDDGSDSAVDSPLGLWVHQGFTTSDRNLPHLVQGGAALDDYTDAAKTGAYRARIAGLLKRAGFDAPEERAARVLALEAAIAKTHASRADTDDPKKTDNTWHRADFAAKAPGLDWAAFFGAAGLAHQDDFLVWQPSAVTGTAALAASQPLDAWKDYLAVHLLDHYAAVLPGASAEGRRQQAVAATQAALSDAMGQLYVARYFPPRAKDAAALMVANIRNAFRAHIAKLDWMSPATRDKALKKLDTLNVGLGYPDHWTDYGALTVTRGDALGNLRRSEAFAYKQAIATLDRPAYPGAWTSAVAPQDAGAVLYFSPNTEQFGAGILQPPYFDPDGDAASNYGSAGAGIAHEISHTFDTLGNAYDETGNLSAQWTAGDVARYTTATAPLAAQYDAYCPAPQPCLHGKQVLSEAAADLAGLTVAYDAYHLSLHGKPDAVVGGLTGDQRFFLAFAHRWRRLQTDAALRKQIDTDSHAPGRYRAATVRNLDAWYAAFGVTPADALYLPPEKRVRLW